MVNHHQQWCKWEITKQKLSAKERSGYEIGKKILSTLGFIFSPDLSQVLLIQKEKPIKHQGQYNGLGGKVEPGESTLDCIIREIEEESGYKTKKRRWIKMGSLSWEEWQVVIFTYQMSDAECSKKPMTTDGQTAEWIEVNNLPNNVITNLPWLIPMCIDKINGNDFKIDIAYK